MLAHNYANCLRSLTVIRESEYATGKQKCANVGLVKACDAISANVGFYLRFQVSSSWLAVKQDSHLSFQIQLAGWRREVKSTRLDLWMSRLTGRLPGLDAMHCIECTLRSQAVCPSICSIFLSHAGILLKLLKHQTLLFHCMVATPF